MLTLTSISRGGQEMNLKAVKEMMAQIKKDVGIQIIKGNIEAPQPPLPYGMYNITSPYIKGRGRGAVTLHDDESGPYEKRTEEYKFIISFSIFGENTETAIGLAHKVRQWFLFLGEEFIREKDLVVSSVGNIQNRTVFLVDDYEYKFGFDVQFRAVDEQIRQIETIEKVEITNLGG